MQTQVNIQYENFLYGLEFLRFLKTRQKEAGLPPSGAASTTLNKTAGSSWGKDECRAYRHCGGASTCSTILGAVHEESPAPPRKRSRNNGKSFFETKSGCCHGSEVIFYERTQSRRSSPAAARANRAGKPDAKAEHRRLLLL